MHNLFKNNKLYRYDRDIVIIEDFEYDNLEFCIDDNGLNIINAVNEIGQIKNGMLILTKAKITLLSDTMPAIDTKYDNECEVNLTHLKEALKFTAKSTNRPELTGVLISAKGIFATDSYKVYARQYDINISKSIVLSREFLSEVVKCNDPTVKLEFNSFSVKATLKDKEIIGKLLAGNYPNLQPILDIGSRKDEEEISIKELARDIEIAKNIGSNVIVEFCNDDVIFTTPQSDNEYTSKICFVDFSKNYFSRYFFTLLLDVITSVTNVIKDTAILSTMGQNKPICFQSDNLTIVVLPIKKQ